MSFGKHNSKRYITKEIEILTGCDHDNIESFLGFCEVEDGRMILVYENFSTKHLRSYLNDRVLTWEKRLKICVDVAHGLNYLHNQMADQKMVIHNFVNSKNIMLDDNYYNAKIVYFGMSVFLPPNQDDNALFNVSKDMDHYWSYHSDPEYLMTGKLKRESDAYGFGVVMFEVLTWMRIGDIMDNEGHKYKDFSHLAARWVEEGIVFRKVSTMVKGENEGKDFMFNKGINKDSLDIFIKIMHQCLKPKQNQRPTMEVVVKELEKALSLQVTYTGIYNIIRARIAIK
ncbi:probable serine/threonine-protein kinase PBL28 [Rutidosis leptorrhynchoides]|uniref:probable serine/threonine-protein kinase PBL28 n=1 Tax=Rutidosis leptorrhynchoides TaxID=125765 RepID=UPI003A996ABB